MKYKAGIQGTVVKWTDQQVKIHVKPEATTFLVKP